MVRQQMPRCGLVNRNISNIANIPINLDTRPTQIRQHQLKSYKNIFVPEKSPFSPNLMEMPYLPRRKAASSQCMPLVDALMIGHKDSVTFTAIKRLSSIKSCWKKLLFKINWRESSIETKMKRWGISNAQSTRCVSYIRNNKRNHLLVWERTEIENNGIHPTLTENKI